MSGRKEDAVNGWIDLEMARQRREELLREAQERRRGRTAAWAVEAGGERTSLLRQILRSMWPGGDAWVATAERSGAPVCGCSAD